MASVASFDGICQATLNTMSSINSKVKQHFAKDPKSKYLAFISVLLFCVAWPCDISQLLFALLGAVVYALMATINGDSKRRLQTEYTKAMKCTASSYSVPNARPRMQGRAVQKNTASNGQQTTNKASSITPTHVPIVAPTFNSTNWDGEVAELLKQITPTAENEETVKQLAEIIKGHILTVVPEIEIAGYANGNFTCGKAFGVAVPEVDIVASASPSALVARLMGRLHGLHSGHAAVEKLDARKLQKSAIRAFTDRLVTQNGFKFRRSAFKGDEPKVTLLATSALGLFTESIPMDFSVNVVTPLYNAALVTECGKIDARAKELILLVKRWAKDRGICHAAKGHLSPYLWGILAMYFLQVEAQLLPSLQHFELSSGLMAGSKVSESRSQSKWQQPATAYHEHSTAELFKEFIKFYTLKFDWRNEAISVRTGCRAPPDLQLPIHIVFKEEQGKDSATLVGPSIEDPFNTNRNLGSFTNAESLARLQEELKRADGLCDRAASLTELLEPWAPDVWTREQD